MIDAMQVELVYKGEQHEHASNSFFTFMSSKIDAKIIGNINVQKSNPLFLNNIFKLYLKLCTNISLLNPFQ